MSLMCRTITRHHTFKLLHHGTGTTKRTYSNGRSLLRHSSNFIKVNLAIVGTPLKSFLYVGGAYGIFCLAYSLISPKNWLLSNNNIYITSIVRVNRTLANAAIILAASKYFYWGVDEPEFSESEVSVDADLNENSELTPQQKIYKEAQHEFMEFSGQRVAKVILSNGGVYIKIGQAMATYSAMLPPELSVALKPLLQSIFVRQTGEVEHMFVEDLGDLPENIFAEFKSEPIAGASIAQVFLGKTKEGQKVAIKVQYHDIAKRFNVDKWTVLQVLKLLDWYSPGIPFLRIMPHIFDSLENELDFVREKENSEECAESLKNLDFLVVPKVYVKLSSRRILTMEFAEGISLIDVDQVKAVGFEPKEIMTKIIRVFSEQIFRTGFIHSDPHPGNILVQRNESTGKPNIVLIDHGLYERLLPKDRQAFATFWHSIIIDDDEAVQKSGKTLGLNYPDVLATLLFFKPYGKMKRMRGDREGGFGPGKFGNRGKAKECRELTEKEKEQFAEMKAMGEDTLNNLPKQLALVFRNIRLTQGINLSFGVPVNRIRLMAQVAVRNSVKDADFILALKRRFKFEWHFFMLDLRNTALAWMLWFYSWFKGGQQQKQISQFALFLKA